MDDAQLIEALRARGLEDAANAVRDEDLARRASEAGRDDVADLIKGKGSAPAEPAKPKTADQAQADAIAHAMKRDLGIDLSRDGEAA